MMQKSRAVLYQNMKDEMCHHATSHQYRYRNGRGSQSDKGGEFKVKCSRGNNAPCLFGGHKAIAAHRIIITRRENI
jgi:hypothetical protein